MQACIFQTMWLHVPRLSYASSNIHLGKLSSTTIDFEQYNHWFSEAWRCTSKSQLWLVRSILYNYCAIQLWSEVREHKRAFSQAWHGVSKVANPSRCALSECTCAPWACKPVLSKARGPFQGPALQKHTVVCCVVHAFWAIQAPFSVTWCWTSPVNPGIFNVSAHFRLIQDCAFRSTMLHFQIPRLAFPKAKHLCIGSTSVRLERHAVRRFSESLSMLSWSRNPTRRMPVGRQVKKQSATHVMTGCQWRHKTSLEIMLWSGEVTSWQRDTRG